MLGARNRVVLFSMALNGARDQFNGEGGNPVLLNGSPKQCS